MNQLSKGQKAPLNHTKQARERIIAGLRWDPREDKVKAVHRITRGDSQHDLDITCYVYNKAGEYIDFIGAEAQDSMDESGKIYHSGDDMTGAGDGDDEFISAELGQLPDDIHALVFLVEIRSNHHFCDVDAPYVRLADGMSGQNLLDMPICHDEGAHKNAFVMCAISRDSGNESGWTLSNISEYPDISQIENWGDYLAQFVD